MNKCTLTFFHGLACVTEGPKVSNFSVSSCQNFLYLGSLAYNLEAHFFANSKFCYMKFAVASFCLIFT